MLAAFACMLCAAPALRAQTEPEAPQRPRPKPVNGFQVSVYTGASLNVFSGGYFAPGDLTFLDVETSVNFPVGAWVNIPVTSDMALYIRGGWHGTETVFFSGRRDSLHTPPGGFGEIGDELTLTYGLFHIDVLARLIGRQDGERVFVGPSFGWVRTKRIRVTETEYGPKKTYLLEEGELSSAIAMRTSIVIGAEYAFMPVKNLYVIPSLQVDYSPQKISADHPMKAVWYKFLLSVSWQFLE
ncbi:MAG: hypothetical protein QHI48_11320 [Bacteroidota bacterium]|nr:hypothetical protein [Bacteroidota bacterium]